MPKNIRVEHIDTCHPDYLTDHCNGLHEELLGVEVTNDTTTGFVMVALGAELKALDLADPDRFHDAPSRVQIEQALAELMDNNGSAAQEEVWNAPFARHLSDATADDDRPSAWFRLSWEPTAVRFEFQATGDETEIFRADDDACTPVVLIPFTGDGEEAAEAHQAFVRFVVAALNARAESEGLT